MQLSKPKTGDYVVIDASFFTLMTRNLRDECITVLKDLFDRGIHLSIPHVVKCELLQHSKDITVFREIEEMIHSHFNVFPIDLEQMESATILSALFYWNEETNEKIKGRSIFNDMLVGTIAAHLERERETNVFILACDGDFMSPYFTVEEKFSFDISNGMSKRYVYLYRADRKQANDDWKTFIALDKECKRGKTTALGKALKAAKLVPSLFKK